VGTAVGVKIACAGGGPGGLLAAILLKAQDAGHDVTVYERNPKGVTYGWGVVFWDDLLASLDAADPETARQMRTNAYGWTGQLVDVDGKHPVHVGAHGYGMGRHRLLDFLGARAVDLGVRVEYEHELGLDDLAALDADVVIASDGVNSAIRHANESAFGPVEVTGRNKYLWLGTSRVFDAFTFAFVHTHAGWIWCHAYGYDDDTSTFIVECAPETWSGLGFDTAPATECLRRLEQLFARSLEGHALRLQTREDGPAPWLTFRTVTNKRWCHGNIALVGDAAHTTHFTIGSGTKLAMEDAIGLATALREAPDVESALAHYERTRQAAIMQPQSEARFSARWFEHLPRYIGCPPEEFFALLKERRSPLLARVPPGAYYRLHRMSEAFGPLRALRHWVGPKARALYSRREATSH
jgi:2-polyprenyl-6-methoxyphenol hydroxylase-like FAD-dependent oxidoreductase